MPYVEEVLPLIIVEEVLEVHNQGLPVEDMSDVAVGRTFRGGGVRSVDGEEGLVEAWPRGELGGCAGLFRVEELTDGVGEEDEGRDEGDDV